MKTINKGKKYFGIAGVWVNRKNWFVAVTGIRIAGACRVCVLLGTHGRYGLMLWDRYVINGARKRN